MSDVVQQQAPRPGSSRGAPGRQVAVPGAAAKKKRDEGVRGGLLLLGVLSGGAFWYIFREMDTREEYLVAVRPIERWEVVGPGDFGVVAANLGTAGGVPPEFVDLLVGRWATGNIPANTIVTPGMFQQPPLSSSEEADKVLIEVSLPAGEAPGGSLADGDKIALFGVEFSEFSEGASAASPTLIGVLELPSVRGDTISYVVTPTEARSSRESWSVTARQRIGECGRSASTCPMRISSIRSGSRRGRPAGVAHRGGRRGLRYGGCGRDAHGAGAPSTAIRRRGVTPC